MTDESQQPPISPRLPVVLSDAQMASWLGKPRWNRYVQQAGGDIDVARELYAWNAQVAAAALVDVAHLEVTLRNAYDRTICAKYPDWAAQPALQALQLQLGHPSSLAAQSRANDKSRNLIAEAQRRSGPNRTHGRVIAETTFGFWANLTIPERANSYWTQMIRHAYPKGTKRGEVHEVVNRINRFRNRLAHHEPLFSSTTGLAQRIKDVHTLHGQLDSDAAAWAAHHSTLVKAALACPIEGLVVMAR